MDWPTALLAMCIVITSGAVCIIGFIANSAKKATHGDE